MWCVGSVCSCNLEDEYHVGDCDVNSFVHCSGFSYPTSIKETYDPRYRPILPSLLTPFSVLYGVHGRDYSVDERIFGYGTRGHPDTNKLTTVSEVFRRS